MMSRVDTDSVSFMPRMRNQFPRKSRLGHHFRTGGGDLRKRFCPCLFQGLEARGRKRGSSKGESVQVNKTCDTIHEKFACGFSLPSPNVYIISLLVC